MKQPGARRIRWRRRLIEIALFAALLLAVRAWTQRGTISGPAPALEGVTLQGSNLSLAQFRGRPVAIYFWATWCPVCRMEQGSVDALARDHAVITVASQSGSASQIAGYMKQHALKYPTLADDDGDLARRFGVKGFPTIYFVSPNGEIRFTEVGYTTGLGMRARMWLAGR